MAKPKKETEQAADDQRSQKKPPVRRQAHEAHKQHAQDNHQSDGMARPEACAVSAEGDDINRARLGIVRIGGPSAAPADFICVVH